MRSEDANIDRDYEEALRYLYRFADMERGIGFSDRSPREFTFDRLEYLLESLGNPQRELRFVHVAGTKGKGSTAAMIASIAQAAGLRSGLYTQPHLHSFRERIMVDLKPIDGSAFVGLIARVAEAVERLDRNSPALGSPTTFEVATVAAIDHFARSNVDLAVMEGGIGGTWDATNVITPLVSVITSLGLEHTAILGETIEEIAAEKAGIIKPGIPSVTVQQVPAAMNVIRAQAQKVGANLIIADADTVVLGRSGSRISWIDDIPVVACMIRRAVTAGLEVAFPLMGNVQLINAGAAVRSVEILAERGFEIDGNAIRHGLESCRWPCRMEVLQRSPLVIADGAHTSESVRNLVLAVQSLFGLQSARLVFGALGDKRHEELLELLKPIAIKVYACASAHPRAEASARIFDAARRCDLIAEEFGSTRAAFRAAVAEREGDEAIIASGSLFVAAEIREEFGLASYVDPVLIPRPV